MQPAGPAPRELGGSLDHPGAFAKISDPIKLSVAQPNNREKEIPKKNADNSDPDVNETPRQFGPAVATCDG